MRQYFECEVLGVFRPLFVNMIYPSYKIISVKSLSARSRSHSNSLARSLAMSGKINACNWADNIAESNQDVIV